MATPSFYIICSFAYLKSFPLHFFVFKKRSATCGRCDRIARGEGAGAWTRAGRGGQQAAICAPYLLAQGGAGPGWA